MEIATTPRRTTATPWGRLAIVLIILGPIAVFMLLPICLGLQRYVMTGDSMDGGIDQGSVVFVRTVPVGDLRVGDVITYRPPAATGVDGRVTHRVVSIDRGSLRTQGDARPDPDPWVLRPEAATLQRVEFAVPWLGRVYVVFHPQAWVLILSSAGILAALTAGEVARGRRGPTLVERPSPAHVGDLR